jgi:hypothetical protein
MTQIHRLETKTSTNKKKIAAKDSWATNESFDFVAQNHEDFPQDTQKGITNELVIFYKEKVHCYG